MTWRVFFTEAVHKNKWCKKITLTRWWSLNFSVVCQIGAISLTIWKVTFFRAFPAIFALTAHYFCVLPKGFFCLMHLSQPWSFMPRKIWSSMPVPDDWYEVIRVFDLFPSSDHSVSTRSMALEPQLHCKKCFRRRWKTNPTRRFKTEWREDCCSESHSRRILSRQENLGGESGLFFIWWQIESWDSRGHQVSRRSRSRSCEFDFIFPSVAGSWFSFIRRWIPHRERWF